MVAEHEVDLSGVGDFECGDFGEDANGHIAAIDFVFAVDHFVEDQMVVGAGIKLSEMDDAHEVPDMVMQIAGHQKIARGRQMHGNALTERAVEVGLLSSGEKVGDDRGVLELERTKKLKTIDVLVLRHDIVSKGLTADYAMIVWCFIDRSGDNAAIGLDLGRYSDSEIQ
jgi:hypothetical protein